MSVLSNTRFVSRLVKGRQTRAACHEERLGRFLAVRVLPALMPVQTEWVLEPSRYLNPVEAT
jgi:hypothetical protein